MSIGISIMFGTGLAVFIFPLPSTALDVGQELNKHLLNGHSLVRQVLRMTEACRTEFGSEGEEGCVGRICR